MEDLVNEKNPPPKRDLVVDPDGNLVEIDSETFDPALIDAEPHRTGPTGPRTPEGKAISSLNRLDHGCCSDIAILPDEDPAEFEFIRKSWFERYDSDNDFAWLIEETVLAFWHYKRASKRLFEIEYRLPGDAICWTEDHHKRFSNFSRYKTTEERRFNRFYTQLEAYDDKIFRRDQAKDRAMDVVDEMNARWISRQEEKMAENLKIDQFIEVDIVDGKCVTSCYPTNEELIKKVALLPRPPIRLARWIQFPKGVPPEYAWVHPAQMQKSHGGISIQKMWYDHWLIKIKDEEATGTGHIGPFIHYPKRN